MYYFLMLVSMVMSKSPSLLGGVCPCRSLFEPLVLTTRPLQVYQLSVSESYHFQQHGIRSAAPALQWKPENTVMGSEIVHRHTTAMSPACLCSLQDRAEIDVNYKCLLSLDFTNLPKNSMESEDQ